MTSRPRPMTFRRLSIALVATTLGVAPGLALTGSAEAAVTPDTGGTAVRSPYTPKHPTTPRGPPPASCLAERTGHDGEVRDVVQRRGRRRRERHGDLEQARQHRPHACLDDEVGDRHRRAARVRWLLPVHDEGQARTRRATRSSSSARATRRSPRRSSPRSRKSTAAAMKAKGNSGSGCMPTTASSRRRRWPRDGSRLTSPPTRPGCGRWSSTVARSPTPASTRRTCSRPSSGPTG